MQKSNKLSGQIKILLLFLAAAMVLAFAVWGPEKLSKYRDVKILDQVTV